MLPIGEEEANSGTFRSRRKRFALSCGCKEACTSLSYTIVSVMFGVVLACFLLLVISRRRTPAVGKAQGEVYFRSVAEALPEIMCTAGSDGALDFANGRWYEYTGRSREQTVGSGWNEVLHPDDLPATLQKWAHSVQTGEPYEIECRFRRASDGTYRWFLGRANPIRDVRGAIVKWVGTCSDIEDQKHNQQRLEEEIKVRTVELADANTRLHEEMLERELARKELDRQNERMMNELKERSQRATLLAKMSELLQSCLSKDEVFSAALGFAAKVFPSARGAIALLNAERNLAAAIGSWAECQLPSAVFAPNSCRALRTGHPHLVVAGDDTARCSHAEGVKNTYLCIPILAQGEALGILHLQATDEVPALGDAELSFKTTFAEQVGLSISNIRLREALRTQSIRDPLTGLYNRRYLEEMLEREIRRAVRAEQSLGILMLDLDHFKRFNDTYGHDAGDAVLRETASFLAKSIRAEDIVCRFGGEEFVVILPTADLEASRARADWIRSKLRELTVLHQGQSVGVITVSVGVAALPTHGTSAQELLQAADAALYCAKREGRDRVVAAQAVEVTELVAVVPETRPSEG